MFVRMVEVETDCSMGFTQNRVRFSVKIFEFAYVLDFK